MQTLPQNKQKVEERGHKPAHQEDEEGGKKEQGEKKGRVIELHDGTLAVSMDVVS